MVELSVLVGGDPVGQPRARHVPAGRGKVRIVSTADAGKQAYREHLIGLLKREAARVGWAKPALVRCDVTMFYATKVKKRWGSYCGKKPDRDNIDKIILDCAMKAKVIGDDATVADGRLLKVWAKEGGVAVLFRSLDGVNPADPEADDVGAFEIERS